MSDASPQSATTGHREGPRGILALPYRILRFLRLEPSDQFLLFKAWMVLFLVRAGLAALSFESLRRCLERRIPGEGGGASRGDRGPGSSHGPEFARTPEDPRFGDTLNRIAWAVTRAARCVPGARCLAQALAARWLLAQEGLGSCLHLGVAREGEDASRSPRNGDSGANPANGPAARPGIPPIRAHAWVTCGPVVVVGGRGLTGYTELSKPGDPAPDPM